MSTLFARLLFVLSAFCFVLAFVVATFAFTYKAPPTQPKKQLAHITITPTPKKMVSAVPSVFPTTTNTPTPPYLRPSLSPTQKALFNVPAGWLTLKPAHSSIAYTLYAPKDLRQEVVCGGICSTELSSPDFRMEPYSGVVSGYLIRITAYYDNDTFSINNIQYVEEVRGDVTGTVLGKKLSQTSYASNKLGTVYEYIYSVTPSQLQEESDELASLEQTTVWARSKSGELVIIDFIYNPFDPKFTQYKSVFQNIVKTLDML